MLDTVWLNGGTKADIIRSIHDGMIDKGMPAWQVAITDKQTGELAEYILKTNKKAQKK